MSCENITQRLNDYCDGDLVGSDRVEIERHLESCAECRAELAALRSLVGEAAGLRQGMEPERDLWPAIENRLRPRSGTVLRGRWQVMSRVGLAAAAALFAAVSLWVVKAPDSQSAVGPPSAAIQRAPQAVSVSLALASERARVESGFMHVREDLLRTLAMRRDEFDPETRELVDQNLEIIDQAMGEIFRALEQDPNNPDLEHRLAATYQREVEFLRQINSALGV